MINIFGKLYTLLRRPQEPPAGEDVSDPLPAEVPLEESAGDCAQLTSSAGNQDGTGADAPTLDSETQPTGDTAESQEMAEAGSLPSGTKSSGSQLSGSPDSQTWEHVEGPGSVEVGQDVVGHVPEKEFINNATDEVSPLTGEPHKLHEEHKTVETDKKDDKKVEEKSDESGEKVADNTVLEIKTQKQDKQDEKGTDNTGKEVKTDTHDEKDADTTDKDVRTDKHDEKGAETTERDVKTDKHDEKGAESTEKDVKTDKHDEKGAESTEKDVKTPKKHGREKVCNYYMKGMKCWKGSKCKFAHVRASDTEEITENLSEADYTSYTEYVHAKTLHSQLITPKDLVYKLGYQQNTSQELIGEALIGQHKLAVVKQNWVWVAEVRYFAELFFPQYWIDEHLPHRHTKSNRKKKTNKKNKEKNELWEKPGALCRDFRLKENPEMECVIGDAGGDSQISSVVKETEEPIGAKGDNSQMVPSSEGRCLQPDASEKGDPSAVGGEDDTEEMIKLAMKMALDDGLSESLIMEVIDDVTNAAVSTPAKPTPKKAPKITKLDVNRTPRKCLDQLAVGFNYHADLVVQSSPKTVKGEIIVIDTLPSPRKRQEQLAVGFNFHADQLVKESPKSKTGEVIIPGVQLTPRRRARDQLAMGFNYHSSQIVGEVRPAENGKEENEDKENVSSQKIVGGSPSVAVKKILGDQKANNINIEASLSPSGKCRKKIPELLAMGFSYNSDIEMLQVAEKLKSGVSDAQELNDLRPADEAEMFEVGMVSGLNLQEPGTPAGSVW